MFEIDFEVHGVESELSNILLDIRYLCRKFFNPAEKESVSTDEASSCHSRVCIILQRLLQVPLLSKPESEEAKISECCRCAAAIYIFLPFENHYPDPRIMINSLLHKLKSNLGSIVQRLESSPLLPWFLSVGGVAAEDLPERDWFVGHLGDVMNAFGLKIWPALRDCLTMVLWKAKVCDGPFLRLWDETALHVGLSTTPHVFSLV